MIVNFPVPVRIELKSDNILDTTSIGQLLNIYNILDTASICQI